MAGEAPPHVGLSGYSNGGSSGGYSNGGSSGGSSGGSGINEYVDEALLARVGELIARGGDGSGTPQGNEGRNIDADILTRVSGSLGDGASSGPSTAYGPPSRSSGPAMLGQPEPAERIAEFDLTDEGSSQQGGYQQAPPAQFAQPSPQYGAPVSAPVRGSASSGGPISLGRPEPAQRVADFSLSGSAGPSRQQSSGGYN